MLKKYFLLLILFSLLVFLAGCGSDGPTSKAVVNPPAEQPRVSQPLTPPEPSSLPPPVNEPQTPVSVVTPQVDQVVPDVIEEPAEAVVPPTAPLIGSVIRPDESLPECHFRRPSGVTEGYVIHFVHSPYDRNASGPIDHRQFPVAYSCGEEEMYILWGINNSERVADISEGVFCSDPEFLVKRLDGTFYDLSVESPTQGESFPACDESTVPLTPWIFPYPEQFSPSTCLRRTVYENKCDFYIQEREGRTQIAFGQVQEDSRPLLTWRVFHYAWRGMF